MQKVSLFFFVFLSLFCSFSGFCVRRKFQFFVVRQILFSTKNFSFLIQFQHTHSNQKTGKRIIYEGEMMDDKIKDIQLPIPAKLERVPWYESMVLTTERKGDAKDASKDVERESKFHDCTMEAVKEGYRRLQLMGIFFFDVFF